MRTGRQKLAAVLTAAVLGASLSLAATPAFAYENWQLSHNAGTNNRLQMSSNTSSSTQYYVDSVIKVSSPSGALSWNQAVSAGYHNTTMITPGTFSSKSAYVYCPSGATCAG
ncbi:hypothetical protein ASF40_06375 [Microbacterium sp. Leaf288]|uniref:hypothetical protein n=1 Tax=Microbacterium sp. Leaf288 TaxID=1736323 RepID=UPI0006F26DBC|nr:hypothetical protein [Microbacterium sp. Leaf288]KQP71396.1 hypothetical protein ASF40_06375 [Microbacterium sp. Leaf288]